MRHRLRSVGRKQAVSGTNGAFMRRRVCATIVVLAAVSCADAREQGDDPRCEARDPSLALVDPKDFEPTAPALGDVAPIGGICDGTREPKVIVSNRNLYGAIVPYSLDRKYGLPFLVIDGQCRFYVEREPLEGVREGQLTLDRVEQITRDLALETLEDHPSSRNQCADHFDETMIATSSQTLRCACTECVTVAGTQTLQRGLEWLVRLADEGTPSTSRLRAHALRRDPVDHPVPENARVFEWPLEAPILGLRGLVLERLTGPGAVFSGADAAALRRIREQVNRARLAGHWTADTSFVRDCGDVFQLELRDELPEALATALEKFVVDAWARPRIVSCREFSLPDVPRVECPPAD